MAVQVFKDGKSEYVEPSRLKAHLSAGWSVKNPDTPKRTLDVSSPYRSLGITEDSTEEEAEQAALTAMGIVPRGTLDNVVIGATRIPV